MTRPALLLALALLPAACGGSPEPTGGPRHVFLISIDTLRADRCSFHGYEQPTTPFLAELAERGAMFENHMVNSNNTLSSHASIMTGLDPIVHDTYDNSRRGRQPLTESFDTVAEAMWEAGYATAAFTTHRAWLDRNFGVLQGFEVVDSAYRAAIPNWRAFLRWYDAERPPRTFAFLHFYDPHSEATTDNPEYPYDSTEGLVKRFAGERPEGFSACTKSRDEPVCNSQWLHAVSLGEEELPDEHARFLSGLYDAGVRKMDDDLRLFFAELEQRGALEDALIVITSDHGEDFYEHGTLLHGSYFEAIMHVPLIVVPPKGTRIARGRVAEVSRSIDIAPTILEFVGLPVIGQGQSLLPAILSGEPLGEPETFFAPAVLRGRDEQGLYKLFALPDGPVFYDLENDPGETTNLFDHEQLLAANEERIARARARVEELRNESYRLQRLLKPTSGEVEVTPEVAATLEELGYIGTDDDDDDEE